VNSSDEQPGSDVQLLAENLGQLPVPVTRPVFIIVSGLPGTGKTFLCRKLAERLPVVVLESDFLRKLIFPSPSYNATENSRLFRAIHSLIWGLLKKGISLILDATNLSERYREQLYCMADRLNTKLILVRVVSPAEVVRERLKVRAAEGVGSSDADWQVYQKLKTSVDRISRKHYAVDTSRDISAALDRIVREARR
jgi:predicted kinase